MPGGAVGAGRTPGRVVLPGRCGERGSQALEFAMVVPLLGLLVGLVVHSGLLLADVVVAQGIAREAGRAAAVDGVDRARDAAEEMAGDREVRVDVDRDGGVVRTRVELASGAFRAVGVEVWLPAQASFREEVSGGALRGG